MTGAHRGSGVGPRTSDECAPPLRGSAQRSPFGLARVLVTSTGRIAAVAKRAAAAPLLALRTPAAPSAANRLARRRGSARVSDVLWRVDSDRAPE